MKLVWVTSFGKDMLAPSGRPLIKSFAASGSEGKLVVYAEGCAAELRAAGLPKTVEVVDLSAAPWLAPWLEFNADVIPAALGGRLAAPECRCKGGPFSPHAKEHRMPCPGHWFCKNASRWFRKIAALRHARAANPDALVWVDADCRFRRPVTARAARGWFRDQAAVFYHKSKRPVMEAGVIGYHLGRGAGRVLDWIEDCYWGGAYKALDRWDDSYVIQKALEKCRDVRAVDLATKVGPHATVIDFGPVGEYIFHDKGRHGRKLGIMK